MALYASGLIDAPHLLIFETRLRNGESNSPCCRGRTRVEVRTHASIVVRRAVKKRNHGARRLGPRAFKYRTGRASIWAYRRTGDGIIVKASECAPIMSLRRQHGAEARRPIMSSER